MPLEIPMEMFSHRNIFSNSFKKSSVYFLETISKIFYKKNCMHCCRNGSSFPQEIYPGFLFKNSFGKKSFRDFFFQKFLHGFFFRKSYWNSVKGVSTEIKKYPEFFRKLLKNTFRGPLKYISRRIHQ